MSKISGDEKNGVGVKPLGEWRRGYCDELVTIQQASFGGMYQIRVLDGVVWLDWPTRTAEEFETVDLAKAAAQADYERRILSALTNTDLSLRAENERLRADAYKDELLKIAADVGEPDDPFAAWEAIAALKAKLEEAAKVMEPIVVITDAVLSEAPADVTKAKLWNGSDNIPLFISLDACRALKSFIANLKGAE